MSGVNARLESAATTLLVAEGYAVCVLALSGSDTLMTCVFLFGLVHVGRAVAGGQGASTRARLYEGVLDRAQLVLLGVASKVAMSYSAFTTVEMAGVPGSVIVYRLAVLLCMLIAAGVLLHGNAALGGLVSVLLYMASDAISLLLESGDGGMLVPCVALVVLVCSARLRPWVDGLVGGLGVVLDVVYMANVNWVLDLVADSSTAPLQHISLLALLLCILEVCSAVEPSLRETQSYALFKVSSLVFAYFLSWGADLVCVLYIAVSALLATRMSESRATGYQLVVLVLMALLTYEFNAMLNLTYGAVKLMSVTCLVVVFETVKVFSEGAAEKPA
jgi:hypothetical protein